MTTTTRTLAALALAACFAGAAAPVRAESATASAEHSERASKLIGAPVYNAQNEKIGTLADLLIPESGGGPSAVVSVGDYLGGGEKMVLVPLSHVTFHDDSATMAATKAQLTAMKAFSFHKATDPAG